MWIRIAVIAARGMIHHWIAYRTIPLSPSFLLRARHARHVTSTSTITTRHAARRPPIHRHRHRALVNSLSPLRACRVVGAPPPLPLGAFRTLRYDKPRAREEAQAPTFTSPSRSRHDTTHRHCAQHTWWWCTRRDMGADTTRRRRRRRHTMHENTARFKRARILTRRSPERERESNGCPSLSLARSFSLSLHRVSNRARASAHGECVTHC